MSALPPSDFAQSYRSHVVPRLRVLAVAHGSSVGHGLESFSDAVSKVTREAVTLGASYMPPEHFALLEDWILTTIAESAATVEAAFADVG